MTSCLVIDHSPALRTVARRILEEIGYKVTGAGDGMAALRACRETMPDLIFLDWNLPHMTGLEFVKALRGLPGGEHPQILYSTTEMSTKQIASAKAAGADEFVIKPFDRTQVRSKLSAIGLAA
jgi:two-component system chemotaxis response regulator CheY